MFTFGWGQPHGGCVQPIKAEDAYAARLKMMQMHGRNWSFQYSEEDFLSKPLIAKCPRLPLVEVTPEEAKELYMSEEVTA
jgi:hypothetical protein